MTRIPPLPDQRCSAIRQAATQHAKLIPGAWFVLYQDARDGNVMDVGEFLRSVDTRPK